MFSTYILHHPYFEEKGTTEQGIPSHKGYRTVFCNPGFHTLQHFGPIPGEALKIMIFERILEDFLAEKMGYSTQKWDQTGVTEQVRVIPAKLIT